ncbi:hypothetical protein HJG60_012021 [Phyllostomus discolor]|uniref:Uncharacterized protein n=1 Tax=Phyllostomus discolor TaxID=89673 RepID=A0A833ZPX4_9CHIR|nr:hypothetical protein HJG60_012021 [Phyllostomus discolor]
MLTVLETGSLRSRCQSVGLLVRALPDLQMATFSLCSHMVKRASSGVFCSYRGTSPIGLGPHSMTSFNLFLRLFIYLFLERGEGKEKERERNISVWLPLAHPLLGTWPATQACALTGNQTNDPLVHRLAFYPLSHTSQGMTSFIL